MISRLTKGENPIDLATAKSYLKLDSTVDDDLVQNMLDASIDWCTSYTSRQYRAGARFRLLLDDFDDRICIRRSPVTAIHQIQYLKNDVWTTVSASVYYLKQSSGFPEVLLADGQAWPTDIDTIEHGVRIDFDTGPHAPSIDQAKMGMLRLISAMYDDRGDCERLLSASSNGMPIAVFNDLARKSGAVQFLASDRMPRV